MKKKLFKLSLFALPLIISVGACNNANSSEASIEYDISISSIDFSQPKDIIVEDIATHGTLFSTIAVSKAYGICDENRFPISCAVSFPDGTNTTTKKDFVAEQVGTYTLTFTSVIGEETITKTVQVVIAGYSKSPLFTLSNSRVVEENKELTSDKYVRQRCNSGIEFNLNASSSSIKYRNLIDLKALGKDKEVISFTANEGLDEYSLLDAKVTIADAYNPSINFSVIFENNNAIKLGPNNWDHGSNNVFVKASCMGQEYANNSEYPALKNFAVSWDMSFWPYTGKYMPISFNFDYETNQILLLTRESNYTKKDAKLVLWDLDDPDDTFKDFPGFTTGEVFVSIEGNGSSGNLNLLTIGEDKFDSINQTYYQSNTGNLLINNFDFDNPVIGAKGYRYELPQFDKCNAEVTTKLYKVVEGQEVELTNVDFNNFVPTEAGVYKVTVSSYNSFGFKQELSSNFVINETPTPINDISEYSCNVSIFDTATVPTFKYSGGNGLLTHKVELVVGDTATEVKEGSPFTIQEKNPVNKFRVTISDQINNVRVLEYPINVSYDKIVFNLVDAFDSASVNPGFLYTIPDFTAIDYSKENISETNIPVIIKSGKTQVFSAGDKVVINNDTTFTYNYGSTVLKTISVRVVPNNISSTDPAQSISKVFSNNIGVFDVSANALGTKFSCNEGNVTIKQPYPVSTSDLNLVFNYFPKSSHFTSIKFRLTSLDGKSLDIKVCDLGSHPVAYVNEEAMPSKIETVSDTYNTGDDSACLGQQYYQYSLTIDGGKLGVFNSSFVKLADLTSWNDGSKFNGFKKGVAQLSVELENAKSNDIFILSKVSNQILTASAFDFGDLTSPSISFTNVMKSSIVAQGTSFDIPKAYAYDVLDNDCDVMMSVMDPNGNYLIKNVPSQSYRLYFDLFGSYTVSYTFYDSKGNGGTVRYIFAVMDQEAPVITLDGEYKDTYKTSDKITVISASVTDNYDKNPTLRVYLRHPNGELKAVTVGQKLSLEKGSYTIIYYAFDLDHNISRISKAFIVK